MLVTINGEPREVPSGISVQQLLELLALPGSRVAVEVNLDVVRAAERGARRLEPGDTIEIVSFVGGGS